MQLANKIHSTSKLRFYLKEVKLSSFIGFFKFSYVKYAKFHRTRDGKKITIFVVIISFTPPPPSLYTIAFMTKPLTSFLVFLLSICQAEGKGNAKSWEKNFVFFTFTCSAATMFDAIWFLFFISQLKKTVLEFLNNLWG
jgi:hypothetical protein